MKKFIKLLSLSFILISVTFTSCSKKNDPSPTESSDSNWKLGTYTYTKGASAQSSSGTFTSIAVSTAGDGGNYGVFSGSALTFIFYNNLGTGKYTLANTDILVANPGAKFMTVTCTIGTAVNTGAILYGLAGNSGVTADVTMDSNGKYHITLSQPVVLIKQTVVGNGIPSAADSYPLTINNAY